MYFLFGMGVDHTLFKCHFNGLQDHDKVGNYKDRLEVHRVPPHYMAQHLAYWLLVKKMVKPLFPVCH